MDRKGDEGPAAGESPPAPRAWRGTRIHADQLVREAGAHAVIFDMDGVLADTQEFHLESWRLLLLRRFGTAPSVETIRSTFGQSNENIIPLLVPEGASLDPGEFDRLGVEKEALYRKVARGRVRPVPGVETFIRWLLRSGIPAAIGTSGPLENIRFLLEEFRWTGWFRSLVDRSRFAASKPSPDCFLAAAALLRSPAGRTIVFEDSLHGLAAARRAGAAPAAIATTFPEEALLLRARWTFRDFTEIDCG